RSVTVLEAEDTIGGGTRSADLTVPGFIHDVCSAVHPLAVGSFFFRTLPLARYGLEFIHPEIPVAHPLDGTTVELRRSLEETSAGLGADASAYLRVMRPLVRNADFLMTQFFAPLRLTPATAVHAALLARFGMLAIRSAVGLSKAIFKQAPTRALLAGLAAHAIQPLENLSTGGYGLMLAVSAHAFGWPVARGGSQKIAYVLLSQPSLFDATRAPTGKHTVWAYCHVPNGSTVDMTDRIEAQIERFAPGFKNRVLARNVMTPADVERHNANCIGGDINGGSG